MSFIGAALEFTSNVQRNLLLSGMGLLSNVAWWIPLASNGWRVP